MVYRNKPSVLFKSLTHLQIYNHIYFYLKYNISKLKRKCLFCGDIRWSASVRRVDEPSDGEIVHNLFNLLYVVF